jgi:hypothetical protein
MNVMREVDVVVRREDQAQAYELMYTAYGVAGPNQSDRLRRHFVDPNRCGGRNKFDCYKELKALKASTYWRPDYLRFPFVDAVSPFKAFPSTYWRTSWWPSRIAKCTILERDV